METEGLEQELARLFLALRREPSLGPAAEAALKNAGVALDRLKPAVERVAEEKRRDQLRAGVRAFEEEVQGRRSRLQHAKDMSARASLMAGASSSGRRARADDEWDADVEDADESAGLLVETRNASKVKSARTALAAAESVAASTLTELDRHGERLGRTRQKLETADERLGAHQRRTREAVGASRSERRKALAAGLILLIVVAIAAWWKLR